MAVVNKPSTPKSVVETALDHQIRERNLGEKYDDVFCEFDRDEHPSFDDGFYRV